MNSAKSKRKQIKSTMQAHRAKTGQKIGAYIPRFLSSTRPTRWFGPFMKKILKNLQISA